MSTISGIVCDNTCVGFAPGDITPDIYLLFGGGELNGKPFTLDIGFASDTLTIGNGAVTWALPNTHFSIGLADPSLGFAAGALQFVATGLYSPAGFAGPEVADLCPAVPEPATWLLLAVGMGLFAAWRRRGGTDKKTD